MSRPAYDTDLSDAQWEILHPLLKCPKEHGGTPPRHPLREIVNAMLYILRTGCAWRHLPHDFPPYAAVYSYFRRWRKNGKLDLVHDALRERVRESEGREATPSAAVIDSQSVPTTEKGGCVDTMPARR